MASMNSHRRCSFVPFVTQITVQPLLEVSASPPNRLSSSGCATIMTFDGLGTPAREEKTSLGPADRNLLLQSVSRQSRKQYAGEVSPHRPLCGSKRESCAHCGSHHM